MVWGPQTTDSPALGLRYVTNNAERLSAADCLKGPSVRTGSAWGPRLAGREGVLAGAAFLEARCEAQSPKCVPLQSRPSRGHSSFHQDLKERTLHESAGTPVYTYLLLTTQQQVLRAGD